jgi:hypothetical protein
MRLPLAATAVVLVTALSGCGDTEPTDSTTADATTSEPGPSAVGSVVPLGRAAADEPGPAFAPEVFQCLVQGEVIVMGPYARDLTDGVTAEVLSFSVTDRPEAEPNTGALYLFADEAAASAHAEAARALAVEDERVDPATAVAEPHGTAVLVVDRGLAPTLQEQALLGCLPDADPRTVVAAPAPGTASLGSLMSCGLAAGMTVRGEHSFFDQMEGRVGFVTFATPDGFGGTTERGRAWVFADAATAATKEPGIVAGEPERHLRGGNVIAEFPGAVDQADPETAAVLGCLPA